jgi:hypothetical protein
MRKKVELSQKLTEAIVDYVSGLIQLKVIVENSETYQSIGEKVGRDKSTVWRWHFKRSIPDLAGAIGLIIALGGSMSEAISSATAKDLAYIIGILEKDLSVTQKLANVLTGPFKETLMKDLDHLSDMTTRSKNHTP